MCTPARAALLTGKNPHSVGCGWLTFNDPGLSRLSRRRDHARHAHTRRAAARAGLLDVHGRQVAQHGRAQRRAVGRPRVVAAAARLRPLLRFPRRRDALLRAGAARRGQRVPRPRRLSRRLLLHRRLDRQGDRLAQGSRELVARQAVVPVRRAQRAARAAAREAGRSRALRRRLRCRLGRDPRRADRAAAASAGSVRDARPRCRRAVPACRRGTTSIRARRAAATRATWSCTRRSSTTWTRTSAG